MNFYGYFGRLGREVRSFFLPWHKRKTAPTSLDEKRRQLKRNVLITMVKILMQI